ISPLSFFFFQAEDGIRDLYVTGVQTCALPISIASRTCESIEKLVGEIRTSVEDIRETVDQQLKAVLQSVQADVNSVTFLPHIKRSEERRVGKECRARWRLAHYNIKE